MNKKNLPQIKNTTGNEKARKIKNLENSIAAALGNYDFAAAARLESELSSLNEKKPSKSETTPGVKKNAFK